MSIPTNASTANYMSYREEQLALLMQAKQSERVDAIVWGLALLVVCAAAVAVVLI